MNRKQTNMEGGQKVMNEEQTDMKDKMTWNEDRQT